MAIEGLVDIVTASPALVRVGEQLRRQEAEFMLTGLSGSQKALHISALVSSLQGTKKAPRLVITHGIAAANQLQNDLQALLPGMPIRLFPALETDPHEEVRHEIGLIQTRLQAIEALLDDDGIVIAPSHALMERLIPASIFQSYRHRVDLESRFDVDQLAADLAVMGYEHVARVEAPGQFGVRGGIIDVYPLTDDTGIRIEMFDDEVDSIRRFDPVSQRSLDQIDEVVIGPSREFFIIPDRLEAALAAIEADRDEQIKRLRELGREEAAETLAERITLHMERLAGGMLFPGIDQYKGYFFSNLTTIIDYAEREGTIVVDEPARVHEQMARLEVDYAERHAIQLEKGRILPSERHLFSSWEQVYNDLRQRRLVHLAGLEKRVPGMEGATVIAVEARTPESFHGQFDRLIDGLKTWKENQYRICFVLSSEERSRRVAEVLQDEGLEVRYVGSLNGELRTRQPVVLTGSLSSGCELTEERIVILTDAEIFGRQARQRRARQRRAPKEAQSNIQRLDSFTDLKEGDYVVHVNHGIGRYVGMKTLVISGAHKDYLVVQYAGDDTLYVPTDQVHLLQKYIGLEDSPPKLYKLGGGDWARVKKRVKESVQEIADGLLKLYAEREAMPGYAFSPDTVWQEQFEDAFPYEETADQLRAIEEVKRDMERSRPMDRLLCGDVGYGKTEVAIRAAFKAVMDGKQVAVLVPTTILAQQHGRTFQERFSAYPVKIRVLSRFQTAAEQNEILRELKQGTIDIIIGTHRLLSKDVEFHDLGMVVVDEEQRFGVVQKERLKELRKSVDVLTLTATPIPRTLHMAMVGARDMSIIETPPEDRYPIRTYVVEYNEDQVREAILREMAREGQVYFVYNQVQTIDTMYRRLQELVPEARIAVAHGQMPEDHLEQVMLDFLHGEYDVLLCSTIIETGMDIANVNTLIIYDADRMGLAQLYQLRGRVGRSNRIAYAYFTYQPNKMLSEQAEKRLQAIREFTELGSGFKIALRDLEIRGAGNILGPEQHGFIASVGFELYCRLLDESVRELKGEIVGDPPDPVIDLTIDAYIPDEYIPDSRQKVEMYKKVVSIRNTDEIQDLEDEFLDRFGDMPEPVMNLLAVARMKAVAREIGVGQINQVRDGVEIRLLNGLDLPRMVSNAVLRRFRGDVILLPGRLPGFKVRSRGLSSTALLTLLGDILIEMKAHWTD